MDTLGERRLPAERRPRRRLGRHAYRGRARRGQCPSLQGRLRLDWVYSAAEVGCAGGGRCSVAPTNVLARGDTYSWNVVAYNPTGWGPWGSWLSFKVGGVPPRVLLVAPSGTINTPFPTYTWNAAGGATVYDLFVQFEPNTSRDRVIVKRRFTAAQVGCADGGRCSFLGPTGGPGAHVWCVRACNAAGCEPWSGGMGFFRS